MIDRLESIRLELLDMGLRNSLLNYRPSRARGAEIVDERSVHLFRLIVEEERSMSFLPGAESEAGELLPPPPVVEEQPADRHTDTRLQTPYSAQRLQARLLRTYYDARTIIEEQGVNTLYLALGMLRWYESESSDVERFAPLILVPVSLDRTSARAAFRLRLGDGDVDANLSLRMKLKLEFGLTLPEVEELDSASLADFFGAVSGIVAELPRWEVQPDRIALGFFSFGKFRLFEDLNGENWFSHEEPSDHPILGSLFDGGFESEPFPHDDEGWLDPHLIPAETYHVVDADGSQSLVLLDVKVGRNLVVQGPPGTGKSQTITNMIAEAIGHGKRVLFVAEKMAALEVVKRRLDQVGIGDACLEVHSHKTNKREFLKELERTLNLGRPVVRDVEKVSADLLDKRRQLNGYCAALNTHLGNCGKTPQQIIGVLVGLRQRYIDDPLPDIGLEGAEGWSRDAIEERRRLVEEMMSRIQAMGSPRDHVFWGVGREVVIPTELPRLQQALNEVRQSLATMRMSGEELAGLLRLPAPEDGNRFEAFVDMSRTLLRAPQVGDVEYSSSDWHHQRQAISDALVAMRRHRELRHQYDSALIPESWEQDVLSLRGDVAHYGSKWWRFASGRWRSARRRITGFLRETPPQDATALLAILDAILEDQRCRATVREVEELMRRLFQRRWSGFGSNVEEMVPLAEWLDKAHGRIVAGELSKEILKLLGDPPDCGSVSESLRRAEEALDAHQKSTHRLSDLLEFQPARRWGHDGCKGLYHLRWQDQQGLFEDWSNCFDQLNEITAWNTLSSAARDRGLVALVDWAEENAAAAGVLPDLFDWSVYTRLFERACSERKVLHDDAGGIFDRDRLISEFRNLDQRILELNRARLALKHWEGLPRGTINAGQIGILRREFEKRSRHRAIRNLMTEAGQAIQAIKPVMMMSPISVATYLPPKSVSFDLVIFDEASQVRPADALGALLRSQTAVVVGDSRQLPPTSFFERVLDDLADETEETSPVGGIESVLGMFRAAGAPERRLRWHYRSRHDSLIAVSNSEFYGNELIIFPSPDRARRELGVRLHVMPDNAYEPGARVNRGEARAVALAAIEHARRHPVYTLGIATFSIPQMEAIRLEMERLRRMDEFADAEPFFSAHPEEPFFVKNLENVQGDERDSIFISMGYGRTAEGRLSRNFGPLNQDGGERRLNVLITRARRRCEVFSNFRGVELNTEGISARGVESLRRYLDFAESGEIRERTIASVDGDSPFEDAVAHAIEGAGYIVDRQVGCSGYFLDLAVRDPSDEGRFILGIECDGASYHSARTARDRDRLRESVLLGMGWRGRFLRIWSSDWFRSPEVGLQRVVKALQEAAMLSSKCPTVSEEHRARSSSSTAIERDAAPPPAEEQGITVYTMADFGVMSNCPNFADENPMSLARAMGRIVATEGPIHHHDAQRRLAELAGVGRIGSRIQQTLEQTVEAAVAGGLVERDGEFLVPVGESEAPIRDRSALPNPLRKADKVSPSEITAAIHYVLRNSFGMNAEEIPSTVCRVLGLPVVSKNREIIERVLRDGLDRRLFQEQDGHVRARSDS